MNYQEEIVYFVILGFLGGCLGGHIGFGIGLLLAAILTMSKKR